MSHDQNDTALIRSGEELSLDRLRIFLHEQGLDPDGRLSVDQFPHGHSNLTYLIHVGDDDYVLRRPPFGNQVASAHDMGREYRILSKLNAVYPSAPRPVAYCDNESVLGAPFYIMERRHGLILRKSLPPGITIDDDLARRMSISLVDNLVELHSIDYRSAGLVEIGKPEGYVQRQVSGWGKRYAQAQTSTVLPIERLAEWLSQNSPAESGAAVIHNDFKYDNVMLDADDLTKVIAVLDWEMATIGDPLMDLGTFLGYWVEVSDPVSLRQSAFGPTALPGSLSRQKLVDRYQEKSGIQVSDPLFYYCFGLFKLAVIVQQIYARFVRGSTADPRFGKLDQLVKILGEQADRALNSGKI